MTWSMMAYEDFKDLTKGTLLIKYCVIKHLILLKIQNMMDINVNLLQFFINFLIKKISGGAIESENMSNKDSSEELLKPIITKLKIKESTLTFYRQYLGS